MDYRMENPGEVSLSSEKMCGDCCAPYQLLGFFFRIGGKK
jgi:hypothetical protein